MEIYFSEKSRTYYFDWTYFDLQYRLFDIISAMKNIVFIFSLYILRSILNTFNF